MVKQKLLLTMVEQGLQTCLDLDKHFHIAGQGCQPTVGAGKCRSPSASILEGLSLEL
jgi:hypothetical protein